MSIQEIRFFGDPVLTTPASLVVDFDKELRVLVQDLTDTMIDAPGAGLAAPQIGVPLRVFVWDVDEALGHLINPTLTLSEELQDGEEGCLSFPFLFLGIKRPKWVSVRYTNENGEEVEETLHGMPGRIFQHENEHMNGYVFTDLVSKLKLERAEKSKQKMIKEIKKRQSGLRIIT